MGDQQQPTSLSRRLRRSGACRCRDLGALLDIADPTGSIPVRSRLLCGALGELALACYHALGGREGGRAVAEAAALLSWLTKLDDQVIDAPDFHRAPAGRQALRRATTAYLAPTLAALEAGMDDRGEARCQLAAELGRRLRALDPTGQRRADLLEIISAGWQVQVDAVERLTAPPASVSLEAVVETTGAISGAWLLMITAVGTLPPDASRRLTPDERRAFYDWGFHIQRADALADLEKDLADGHLSSWPCYTLRQRAPTAFDDADLGRIYQLVADHQLDLAALPEAPELEALDRRLSALGEVPAMLRWIHGFLIDRYLAHPRCARSETPEPMRSFVASAAGWRESFAVSAPVGLDGEGGGVKCSGP